MGAGVCGCDVSLDGTYRADDGVEHSLELSERGRQLRHTEVGRVWHELQGVAGGRRVIRFRVVDAQAGAGHKRLARQTTAGQLEP